LLSAHGKAARACAPPPNLGIDQVLQITLPAGLIRLIVYGAHRIRSAVQSNQRKNGDRKT
jgi:hypothetical protein